MAFQKHWKSAKKLVSNNMKITKNVLKIIPETVAIKCDACGKEYSDVLEMQEFLDISSIGSYGSIFGDGHSVEVDICQHCLKNLLGKYLRVSSTSLIY